MRSVGAHEFCPSRKKSPAPGLIETFAEEKDGFGTVQGPPVVIFPLDGKNKYI